MYADRSLTSFGAKLAVVLGVGLLQVLPSSGDSSCVVQPENGSWLNADANTRSFTAVDLRFVCQHQILNGELYPPGRPWYVHVFGKCHPTDFGWYEVGAQRFSSDRNVEAARPDAGTRQ